MRHVTNLAARLLRTHPQDGDRAPRRMRQSRQSPQQSRLPCSVVAKNHMKLAGGKFRIHAAQCGEASELLYESGNDNDGGTGGRCRRVRHKRVRHKQ